jgi:polygalacturonase
MVREGRVFISSGSKPDFGSTYSVQVLEIGAQVTSGSSGTTITVRAGHGFAAGDKVMRGTDVTTFSATNVVASVTSTTVVMNSAYTVAAGDLLVNLAVDSSTAATPNYDGAGLTVYTTMDYTATATNNTVTTDANGRYRYYHRGIARWELVRTGSTLISLYTDTVAASASVINVKDYGATGDGTTDDTVAIQSALTAVPSTGGKVYVPAGTYIVSTSLFAKSATHLCGDGIGVTILKRKAATQTNSSTTLTGPILTAGPSVGTAYSNGTPGSKITISDMTLDCDYTNQTATQASKGNNAIRLLYVSGLTIQRVEAINTLETAIEATFSNNVLIDSNVVSAAGKLAAVADANGISVYYGHATSWGQNVVITHNRITDIGVSGAFASEGIATYDLDFVTITDNEIGSIINGAGIEINVTTALACVGYNISDNQIHDCAGTSGFGVTAGISGTIKGMRVSNNTISNVKVCGLYINFCSGLVVEGNSVYNSNTVVDATYFNAIDILNSDAPNVTSNIVLFSSAAAGVYGIRAFACTNGQFSDNVVKTPTAACLIVNVGSQNNLVTSNRLVGGTYGVQIHNSGTNSGNYVYANYCSGQSTSAYFENSGQTNYLDLLTNGAFTVPGALTVTGNIAGSGSIRGLKATEALTTSAAITTAGRMLIDITNTSGSNTPTLVAPSSVDGQILILRCVALTAGTITLADSGNVALSAAWIPDAGDTLTLIASGVIFYEIARSAN